MSIVSNPLAVLGFQDEISLSVWAYQAAVVSMEIIRMTTESIHDSDTVDRITSGIEFCETALSGSRRSPNDLNFETHNPYLLYTALKESPKEACTETRVQEVKCILERILHLEEVPAELLKEAQDFFGVAYQTLSARHALPSCRYCGR